MNCFDYTSIYFIFPVNFSFIFQYLLFHMRFENSLILKFF